MSSKRVIKIVAAVVLGLFLMFLVPGACLVGIWFVLAVGPKDPARQHLEAGGPALVEAAHRLLADPNTQGHYRDLTQPGPWRDGIERGSDWKSMDGLPAEITALKPRNVSVFGNSVDLTWFDDPRYGYGYTLILLAPGADESGFVQQHGNFQVNIKLQEGAWSHFQHH